MSETKPILSSYNLKYCQFLSSETNAQETYAITSLHCPSYLKYSFPLAWREIRVLLKHSLCLAPIMLYISISLFLQILLCWLIFLYLVVPKSSYIFSSLYSLQQSFHQCTWIQLAMNADVSQVHTPTQAKPFFWTLDLHIQCATQHLHLKISKSCSRSNSFSFPQKRVLNSVNGITITQFPKAET